MMRRVWFVTLTIGALEACSGDNGTVIQPPPPSDIVLVDTIPVPDGVGQIAP